MRGWLLGGAAGAYDAAEQQARPHGPLHRGLCLQGQRVVLRLPHMRDAQDLFTYARDPEVARYVLWDAHQTLRDSKEAIRGMQRRNRGQMPGMFMIELKAEGRAVGTIGFQAVDWENRRAEVGYSLARRLWGHGLALEALTLLRDYAFDTLGLERLEARHDSRNPASGRVLEKAGFTQEGVERRSVMLKGERADMVWYALLKQDKNRRVEP